MKNFLNETKEIIVLLSGDNKFALDIKYKNFIIEEGKKLFNMLKESRLEDFSRSLKELHEFIKKNGKPIDVLRGADIIIPPLNIDPQDLREIFF
jgi:hypothetical protein